MSFTSPPRLTAAVASLTILVLIVAACGADPEIPPTSTPQPFETPDQPRPTATSLPATTEPTATRAPATPTTAPPTATAAAQPTSPPGGNVDAGRTVFLGAGCTACHTIDGLEGATGNIGPNLTTVGVRARARVVGVSADVYLRTSVENPTAFVVEGFPPAMPGGLASGTDLDNLVAFLLSLK